MSSSKLFAKFFNLLFFLIFVGSSSAVYAITDLRDIPECEILKENSCQKETSGGHMGTIFSVKSGKGGVELCAKLVSSEEDFFKFEGKRELKFYSDAQKYFKFYEDQGQTVKLKNFILENHGYCKANGNVYFIMENLKSGMQDPWELDTKVGKNTVNFYENTKVKDPLKTRLEKIVMTTALDLVTSSRCKHVRVDGSSQDVPKGKKPRSRFALQRHLKRSLGDFYNQAPPVQKQCIAGQFKDFVKAIEQQKGNMNGKYFDDFYIIAGSVLVTYDRANNATPNCRVRIIDPAHGHILLGRGLKKQVWKELYPKIGIENSFKINRKRIRSFNHSFVKAVHNLNNFFNQEEAPETTEEAVTSSGTEGDVAVGTEQI